MSTLQPARQFVTDALFVRNKKMSRVQTRLVLLGGLAILAMLVGPSDLASTHIPQERILPQQEDWENAVSAQSIAGNGDALTIYFRSVDGVDQGAVQSCPSGWTEVVDGYGPHYIATILYEWFQNGTGGTGGGHAPGDGDGDGDGDGGPDTTPGGEPGPGGPTTPGGGGGDGDGDGDGGPDLPDDITPGGGPDPLNPEPPVPGPGWEPGAPWPGDPAAFWEKLLGINKAYAQLPNSLYVRDVDIGSDSVCANTNQLVVPMQGVYQSNIWPVTALYSDACQVDPVTATVTCNRCKVCVK